MYLFGNPAIRNAKMFNIKNGAKKALCCRDQLISK